MNTPIANMIAEMHGKGIPVELIVSAVATFEEAMAARAVSTGQQTTRPVDTSTIDKRRAWDRERKRRQRVSANSAGHPPDSTGIPPDDACIMSSNKEEISLPRKEAKEKKESKSARGNRIPPDFAIDDVDRAFAASLGIPPDIVEAETPQFIDYWSSIPGNRGVKLSWKGTWRNRMRDVKKRLPTTRGIAKPATVHQQERQTGRDILNDIGEFVSSSDSQASPRLLRYDPGDGSEGLRGGAGGNLVELSASGARSRS